MNVMEKAVVGSKRRHGHVRPAWADDASPARKDAGTPTDYNAVNWTICRGPAQLELARRVRAVSGSKSSSTVLRELYSKDSKAERLL